MTITYTWRGDITNVELNSLHAEAFETRVFDETEWNWQEQLYGHSLGWVVARRDDRLVGFVNVPWDGLVHAWIQDTMVAVDARRQASERNSWPSPCARLVRRAANGSTSTSTIT
jgi:hypothetical protein